MNEVTVLLKAKPGFEPIYANPGDAGCDLRATEDVTLRAGERALVSTGVELALPSGYVGLVHPRSGLALKHGITVLNSPGTIDASYRGEIRVTLFNSSGFDYEVKAGDRIAQLLVQEVSRAKFVQVSKLPDSNRGASGFGSTGVS